ncbi:MAG: hypothetical protein M0C28_31315 [Candidatus Moduliflexus flocculans]|nr:hypothetical protein [Candidatus Moduliflexus flocculans]
MAIEATKTSTDKEQNREVAALLAEATSKSRKKARRPLGQPSFFPRRGCRAASG